MNTTSAEAGQLRGQGAVMHVADLASGGLNLQSFESKFGGVTRSRHKSGDLLYEQGQPADCMFYLEQGQIQLAVRSAQGKQAIIGLLTAGDFCGEGYLVGDKVRSSAARCIADSAVARLDGANMVRAMQQDLRFAEFCLTYFLDRTVRLTERLLSQHFDSCEQRLARILLLLANHGKEGRATRVIRNLDQKALAQMIGTSRSRVNYFMNKFRDLGFIDYNGHIVVHGSLLNVVQHDGPPRRHAGRMSASTAGISARPLS